MEDVEMRELLEGVAAAGSWAVWMGVFSRSWMKLLTAEGLSYKRARIVTGKISAIISEYRCAVAKVRHERAARESAEAMAERRRILELDVRKYHAMDRRSVGSGKPPLDQLLANGVVAQRKYVRRQRNAEEGRAKEVERKDRVVSLRAASAAGRARAAAIANGQICSWQRTIYGGRIRVQQAAPKRRRAGKAQRAAAGGGSVVSFFPVIPPSSPGSSSNLPCAGVPSGARAAASAVLVARNGRVAAALCSV
jgi:hypothetical protein